MSGLPAPKLAILTGLVRSAPDRALLSLDVALATQSGPAMAEVRSLVVHERETRRTRDRVFAPLAPLYGDPEQGFPVTGIKALWEAVKEASPCDIRALATQPDDEEITASLSDSLCRLAAEGLKSGRTQSFVLAAERLGPEATPRLVACLELAPVARESLRHLPEWLGRLTGERAAAARLAFKDAVSVADDAGPLLLQILAAHLDEPWHVLRLISAVMDRPSDSFVAASELAGFGEKVLDGLDRQIAAAASFDALEGRPAGEAAGRAVQISALQIAEFDYAFELSKTGPWAVRLTKHKRALAAAVESRLRTTQEAVFAALPLKPGMGKAARGRPRLDADPDPAKVAKAEGLCGFLSAVRPAAAAGGFASARANVAEALESELSQYVEDLLEVIHANEGDLAGRARLYLDIAADLIGDATEEKAAQIVRRRAAVA